MDSMDRAAGLAPEDTVFGARRFRPEFVKGAELCRASALTPASDLGLSAVLRVALARRMAALNEYSALIAEYDAQFSALEPTDELKAVAGGAMDLREPLATIVRHVDLVTLTPDRALASDIARLVEAGLDNPQIVALSELIAFVNFQIRVATGLRLLKSA
mgnify:CR=1 FL=1